MATKPIEANKAFQPSQGCNKFFNEVSFFEGVLNNEYILVVGSGIILNREKFPETGGDINQYIVNHHNSETTGEKYNTVSEIAQNTSETSKLSVRNIINGLNKNYDISNISPELVTLLEQKLFRFVFTTTPDHYLEKLLKGIWGNELRIVNISDQRTLSEFSKSLTEDFKTNYTNYTQPTLFYVFGKATRRFQYDDGPGSFLQTDNDAITYIEKWLKFEDDNSIIGFLKSKRIFGLGCNFDDWYYRFFWHILTRDFVKRDEVTPYKTDNAVLQDDIQGLQGFLDNLNVCIHTDPWSVLDYMNHLLTANKGRYSFKKLIEEKMMDGRVFISYKTTPDRKIAEKLVKELSNLNFKIWFDDSSLLGGQPYNKKIPEAIRFSRVFIPLLTETVAQVLDAWKISDLKEKGLDEGLPFFIQEWKWAKRVADMEIIPVAFEGYYLGGSAHKKFLELMYDSIEEDAPSVRFIGTTAELNNKEIEKLTNSIQDALSL